MHDLDRTLRTYEPEMEETSLFGELPLSEDREIALANELLSIGTDQELDQFLGNFFKRAGRAAQPFLKFLKPVAKKLLPIAATAVGTVFGGPAGGAIAGKLGAFATTLFEGDFESAGEPQMEVARQVVRIAADAAARAAQAPASTNINQVARAAVLGAVQTHAPALLRAGVEPAARSGRWERRGQTLVVIGV